MANPLKDYFEAVQSRVARGQVNLRDSRWLLSMVRELARERDKLLAELSKYRGWHKNSLELIAQQAELIREANARLGELNKALAEVGPTYAQEVNALRAQIRDLRDNATRDAEPYFKRKP
jgi:DNA repair exonuclease SbcCD ATPase subunit